MQRTLGLVCLALVAGPGCLSGDPAPSGPAAEGALSVNVAALDLEGVGDVVWDLEVLNGGDDVVWQRRLTSSGYGDGAGSASYVGTCDASDGVSDNTVRVWVVGVYAGAVTASGSFNGGSDAGVGAVTGTTVPFQNPTSAALPLEQDVVCVANADVAVQFDVALMRPAQQGFFDIAVNFNDVFCSAKLDCCADADGSDSCDAGEDIALLFDASGARASTMVLGFACTAGAADDVQTQLYLDPLQLDCTSPTSWETFGADITINPAGAAGNQCTAGANGMSTCAGVITESGVDADTYLFQVGVYRGLEQLLSGGVSAQKVYWNIALGVKRPAIEGCWLRTRGTADDAAGTSIVNLGNIAAGAVYPYIQWEADLGACVEEPLDFDDATAMVRPEYTGTDGTGLGFTYGYGAAMAAGPFCPTACQNGGQCVSGACVCPAGYSGTSCETNDDDCAPNPCLNGGVCTDGVDGYSCACPAGFEGTQCETNIDDCAPNPCLNGGACVDGVDSFTCDCAPTGGWSGPNCEVPPVYEVSSAALLDGASDYLSWVPGGAPTSRKTWTFSIWLKRWRSGDNWNDVLHALQDGSNFSGIYFTGASVGHDRFHFSGQIANSYQVYSDTRALFRDTTAWTHYVVSIDTTQPTREAAIRYFVNGEQITDVDWHGYTYVQNADYQINAAGVTQNLFRDVGGTSHLPAYVAEAAMVDGAALDPDSFGQRDAFGNWRPVDLTGLAWGSNGYWLDFADALDLGADVSGNDNHWTVNGSPVPVADSPTANYATLNAAAKSTLISLSEGNLTTNSANGAGIAATHGFSSGRYYWEATPRQAGGANAVFAPGVSDTPLSLSDGAPSPRMWRYDNYNGRFQDHDSDVVTGLPTTTFDETVGVAVDMDAGLIWFRTAAGWLAGGDPAAGTNPALSGLTGEVYPAWTSEWSRPVEVNFGQTAYVYTPPAGFADLTAAGLEAVDVPEPAAYFDVVTFDGDGGANQTISWASAAMDADFLWFKVIDIVGEHHLHDVVRGLPERVHSNTSGAADSDPLSFLSSDPGSFTVGIDYNTNGRRYHVFGWRAGGDAVANGDGAVASMVTASDVAGFSVVTYTGTNTVTSVGHGLGAAPAFVVIKNRTTATDWVVYHENLNASFFLALNQSSGLYVNSNTFDATAPDASVIHLGPTQGANGSGDAMVAYAWREVPGFSRFGRFDGNGSTDGHFIELGFRPAFFMAKRTDGTSNWIILDDDLDPYNPVIGGLWADLDNGDSDTATVRADFLANGVKIRAGGNQPNASGSAWVYAAFAARPFGGANVAPGTAR